MENDPDLFSSLIELSRNLLSFVLGDDTASMRAGIAVHEYLLNAFYHGNLECSSDLRQEDEADFYRLADERLAVEPFRSRRVHVETRAGRDGFRIAIRDDGPGFDAAGLAGPIEPEDLARVGGRGLVLARSFMDEVFHNKVGNEITLIKRGVKGVA